MASGNTLITWGPQDMISGTATFDTRTIASSLGQMPVLDFDGTTDEYAIFGQVMPRHYAGGGVTVTIYWMSTSATTGDVTWDVAFKSATDDADDLDTKVFDTARSGTETTSDAAGEIKQTEITFTNGDQMDFVAAGEYFQFYLNRDASADSHSSDAELVAIEIRET